MAHVPSRSVMRSRREFWTFVTLALEVSAAPWQGNQRASAGLPVESVTLIVFVPLGSVGSGATPPKLWKMFRPRLAESLSAALFLVGAFKNRSTGLSSAISVSMYALSDRPQN